MSARNEPFPPRRWSNIHVGVAPNRDARWNFDPFDVPSYRTPTHSETEFTVGIVESADTLEVLRAQLNSR